MARTAIDARPRLPRAHRPLAPPHRRPRAEPRAARRASWARSPRLNERAGPVPHPHRHRGRHPRGRRRSTRTSTCWPSSTSSWPASTRSCGWTAAAMTRRMVLAVASPHVDILGHCTGRKLRSTVAQAGSDPELVRPESTFDPEIVFAACARFDTAVEINCRPERQDPPDELLELALEWGCKVSIDTDAHAPGPARVAAPRLRQGGPPRDRPRPDRQHVVGRRPRRLGHHSSDGLTGLWSGTPPAAASPSGSPPHQRLRRAGEPASRLPLDEVHPVAWSTYVEEDRKAQDQRPTQEGEPRAQAQCRARLTASSALIPRRAS